MLTIAGGIILAIAMTLVGLLVLVNFRAFMALVWTAACVSIFIYLVGATLVR